MIVIEAIKRGLVEHARQPDTEQGYVE